MKTIITLLLTVAVCVPLVSLATSGIVSYGGSNTIKKHYDHDEGIVCYTYSDIVASFGDNMLVGGISCVKD